MLIIPKTQVGKGKVNNMTTTRMNILPPTRYANRLNALSSFLVILILAYLVINPIGLRTILVQQFGKVNPHKLHAFPKCHPCSNVYFPYFSLNSYWFNASPRPIWVLFEGFARYSLVHNITSLLGIISHKDGANQMQIKPQKWIIDIVDILC